MQQMKKVIILGGGISGLACEFFLNLGQEIEVVGFEKNSYFGGHAYSWEENGGFWDDGPHVFFGEKNDVEPFFDFSNDTEIDATVLNFADGNWINHPVYVNLVDLPVEVSEKLARSLINAPSQTSNKDIKISNYNEFLTHTYGDYFAGKFPLRYNDKYWRSDIANLSTDWVNSRMFKPTLDQILKGTKKRQNLHYINKFRYPISNGYSSYFREAISNSKIKKNIEIKSIDLGKRSVTTELGEFDYDHLINTMPLTSFIKLCKDVPVEIYQAIKKLECTSMLIVNVSFDGEVEPFFHWAYIHDTNFFSTRITNYSNLNFNLVDRLNIERKSQSFQSRLQIEVYESISQPFKLSHEEIAKKVVHELVQMGLIPKTAKVSWSTRYSKMANVIFNLDRENSLEIVYSFLGKFGLDRTENDLSANFIEPEKLHTTTGILSLVGRFAQWNYYWTHDCIKKAKITSSIILETD
jgi:protoporphyrinogen oxidase